jgi:hypothetical protein
VRAALAWVAFARVAFKLLLFVALVELRVRVLFVAFVEFLVRAAEDAFREPARRPLAFERPRVLRGEVGVAVGI